MKVSRDKIDPTDEEFKNFLRSEMTNDYYLQSLSTNPYKSDVDDPTVAANRMMKEYDFIGVTERMDESAVLIMMLLDLPMSDILFLSAKGHGGYDGGSNGRCTYIWPSFVSDGMQSYFESDEWKERVNIDLAIYQAVNRSMDLTIERLGRVRFENNLQKFQHAQQVAIDKCLATTKFPCNSAGEFKYQTDCLWKDSGCGSDCLDEVATELNLW
jgi:hypothetical protein